MGTVYCDNCGTSLLEENAKFCRACGKATPLSEAATKRFDQQPGVQNPTSPVGSAFTTPAYLTPFELPPAADTNDLRKQRQKRNLIILAGMLVVMILALGGLLAFLNFGLSSDGIPSPPPPPPGFSGPAGPPPPPPPPPVVNGPSTIDPTLLYPGAHQTMSVNQAGGKSVVRLQSDDAARKVAAWYTSRLQITSNISIAGQTILKAGDIGIVITGGDDGAQIIITSGGNEE